MKYMGSKSRVKKYLIPIMQNIIDKNNIKIFVDLFCGGCSIVDSISADVRYANDISTPLISLFQYMQNGGKLLDTVSKEFYDDVRNNDKTDKYPEWVKGNVGFLASYNGRYFDGGYAKTGLEKGRVRDYYQESKRNIETQILLLKDVIFTNYDYRELHGNDMLIYMDPPYEDTKQYNTSKNFNHSEFWSFARKMSETNIVLISELQAPEDFICIWEQEVSRSIKAQDKSKAVEKLFIYNSLIEKI